MHFVSLGRRRSAAKGVPRLSPTLNVIRTPSVFLRIVRQGRQRLQREA